MSQAQASESGSARAPESAFSVSVRRVSYRLRLGDSDRTESLLTRSPESVRAMYRMFRVEREVSLCLLVSRLTLGRRRHWQPVRPSESVSRSRAMVATDRLSRFTGVIRGVVLSLLTRS